MYPPNKNRLQKNAHLVGSARVPSFAKYKVWKRSCFFVETNDKACLIG